MTLSCSANDEAHVELYKTSNMSNPYSGSTADNIFSVEMKAEPNAVGYYACKAKWDNDESKTLLSDEAFVFVFDSNTESDTKITAIPGHAAKFSCSIRSKLMASETEALMTDGQNEHKYADITWSFEKDGEMESITGENKR